jgi:hypothetical protein
MAKLSIVNQVFLNSIVSTKVECSGKRLMHSGLTPGNNFFPDYNFFPKIIYSHLCDSIENKKFEFGSIISKFYIW